MLGAGEPDFDTPRGGEYQGSGDPGHPQRARPSTPRSMASPELKAAIVAKFQAREQSSTRPSEIRVGTGGKQVLYNALMATLNPGDEVDHPGALLGGYPEIVALGGGTPGGEDAAASGFRRQAGGP